MKNWKKSYFVLGAGKLSYYTDEMKDYPYGDGLKVGYCFTAAAAAAAAASLL